MIPLIVYVVIGTIINLIYNTQYTLVVMFFGIVLADFLFSWADYHEKKLWYSKYLFGTNLAKIFVK